MASALYSLVRTEDAARIARGVARLRSAPDLDALAEGLLDVCAGLIPADHASYAELDPYFGRTVDRSTSAEFSSELAKLWDSWQAVMHTQPIIRHYAAHPADRPRRMSDVIDDSGLRATPFWSEVMRPLGSDRQLVLSLGVDPASGPVAAPLILGVNMNRHGRDFTDGELATVSLLEALVRPIYRAKRARRHYDNLVGGAFGPGVERLLRGFGLSPRQAEVAFWILRDKSNPEIADILRIGSQTVRQHSMAIYDRLGVGGRMALQRTVLAAIWHENGGA